jgi:hypothetical protein
MGNALARDPPADGVDGKAGSHGFPALRGLGWEPEREAGVAASAASASS